VRTAPLTSAQDGRTRVYRCPFTGCDRCALQQDSEWSADSRDSSQPLPLTRKPGWEKGGLELECGMLRLRTRASNLVGLPGFERYDSRVSLSGALHDLHRCHDILSHVILLLYCNSLLCSVFILSMSNFDCILNSVRTEACIFGLRPLSDLRLGLPRSPSTCTLYGKLCKLYALSMVPPLVGAAPKVVPLTLGVVCTVVAMATVLYSIAVI